jgi:isoleucyl-tRNA synthetase
VDTIRYAKRELLDYNSQNACAAFEEFVRDLSTWYLRRSRERVWIHTTDSEDRDAFYRTLQYVLTNLSVSLSPMLPFLSEELYTALTGNESVHLASWPEEKEPEIDSSLLRDMELVRNIVEAGHRVRKELKIKVRQPLASATVRLSKGSQIQKSQHKEQYLKLLREELNVKEVGIMPGLDSDIQVTYDTVITNELETEGKLRDLIRTIQSERKKKGITIDQKVAITVPKLFEPYLETIQKSVYTEKITFGDDVSVDL